MRLFECSAVYVRGTEGQVVALVEEFPSVRVEAATIRIAREALFAMLAGVLAANRAAAEATLNEGDILRREIIRPEARRNPAISFGPRDDVNHDEDVDETSVHLTDAELDRHAIHAISDIRTPFTAVHVRAREGGVFSFIAELPGIHGQGGTVEESRRYLQDALELTLSSNGDRAYGRYFLVERIDGERDDDVDYEVLLKEPLDFHEPGAGPYVGGTT